MAEVTIPIPKEIEDDLKAFSPMNWQLFAQRKLSEELEKMAEFRRIVSKSKLTEEDAMLLAKEINAGMYRKLKKLHPELR